jgi:hypothetical protein
MTKQFLVNLILNLTNHQISFPITKSLVINNQITQSLKKKQAILWGDNLNLIGGD